MRSTIHRSQKMKKILVMCVILLAAAFVRADSSKPIPVIFDTDMGNDVDDAMALAILNALIDRGECDLLAVTLTKSAPSAASYVQLIDAYFGHPDIPIGTLDRELTPDDGAYIGKIFELKDESGNVLFAKPTPAVSPAVPLLRQKLAAAEDGSVVLVQVGFSTNLAGLLDTPADEYSPLTGKELVAQKVKLLSTMFGGFNDQPRREYNVVTDIPSAQKLVSEWPTPIWFSGYEIGTAIQINRNHIDQTFRCRPDHPIRHSFLLYRGGGYDNQSTYDLTSVLLPIRFPEGYFDLSAMGRVSVDDQGIASFTQDESGLHQYIRNVTPEQVFRIREAFLYLMSQPAVK